MRLSKRRVTSASMLVVVGVVCALVVATLYRTNAPAHAVSVDVCEAGDTLQCLKTIDDDRTPVDDVGDVTGNQDNTGGNPSLLKNVFVNDPCLDPAPPANYNSLNPADPIARAARRRTVQSETSIGVLYAGGSQKMVVGYNDSFGFYDNRQGLSGYAYTVDGGAHWIDGGGLPPAGTSDLWAGDPVIAVDQRSGTFYYSSIYLDGHGHQTLAVARGHFQVAPPSGTESNANTRCLNHPELSGIADTTNLPSERIVWEPPVVAVNNLGPGDALDKEWIFARQQTGELYMSYTRFNADHSTPLELVRSTDGGHTWTAPTTIVPNLSDTFNQATQPVALPDGRVVVTWIARTFSAGGAGPESDDRIEVAISNNDGATFGPRIVVSHVNPQGEPKGYNRGRRSILNAPFITFAPGGQQGNGQGQCDNCSTVYLTYFNGKTPLMNADGTINTGPLAKAADILVSRSSDDGQTWLPPAKVNDDAGTTSHVFSSVQANASGDVFVAWLDRRADATNNEFTNEYADASTDGGVTFGTDRIQSDVATTWRVRADARPNFGDYNSSVLLGDGSFAMVWADGRFTPVANTPATPDTFFSRAVGLGQN